MKHLKKEIAEAALAGIQNYLSSTRGAQFFRNGRAYMVPTTKDCISIEFKIEGQSGLQFLELNVKAPRA